jgi:cytochrome P450
MIKRPMDARGKLPPGPSGYSLIANLHALSTDPVSFFARCSREYGDIVYLRLAHISFCLFTHPRDIEHVLVTNASNFEKTADIRVIRMVLGNGLLTAEGPAWQKGRKLSQPAFRHENIAVYGELMVRLAEEKIADWQDGQMLDIHQQMMALALDVVAKSLLGSDLYRRARAISDALNVLMGQFVSLGILAFLLPDDFPLPRSRRFRRSLRQLDAIISEAIEDRRSVRGTASDLLEILLRTQDEDEAQMTDERLRDEIKTVFVTGHETTANALSWTWYLLAQHPEVEAVLHRELAEVLEGRIPTVSDLCHLPYTEMVIKEALRLYPALSAQARRAVGAFETGGFHFPAGTNVAMMTCNTHRDSRFFPEPERFNPERWNADCRRRNPIPRFAYFPFGGGPRTCIGAGFAMMETTLLLATIAQRYRLTLVPGQEVKTLPSLTLRPKNGIQMVVHKLQSYPCARVT